MRQFAIVVGFFLGILLTFVNIQRAIYRASIPSSNYIVWALGWTLFAWGMWFSKLI